MKLLVFLSFIFIFSACTTATIEPYQQDLYSLCTQTGGTRVECQPCEEEDLCTPCTYCNCPAGEIFNVEKGCIPS